MEEEKIKEYVLRLLKYRPRSKKEIIDKLKKKKIPSDSIEKIVKELSDLRLIDDRDFVRFWINWRTRINPRSKNFIFWELRQKGISEELIAEELKVINKEEDYLQAEELARKKFQRLKNIEPEKAKRRLYGFLQRRGFNQEIIFEVINKLFS